MAAALSKGRRDAFHGPDGLILEVRPGPINGSMGWLIVIAAQEGEFKRIRGYTRAFSHPAQDGSRRLSQMAAAGSRCGSFLLKKPSSSHLQRGIFGPRPRDIRCVLTDRRRPFRCWRGNESARV